MVTISAPVETRTLLENISWQTFKAMLADMGSSRNTRLAYENGVLEIMAPYIRSLLNLSDETRRTIKVVSKNRGIFNTYIACT